MARYTFICDNCGKRGELVASIQAGPGQGLVCACGEPMKRDYRADSPRLSLAELKKSQDFDPTLVLPTAEEMAGPDDPDGTKGLRKWNEEHEPRPSNKHPMRPGGRELKVSF